MRRRRPPAGCRLGALARQPGVATTQSSQASVAAAARFGAEGDQRSRRRSKPRARGARRAVFQEDQRSSAASASSALKPSRRPRLSPRLRRPDRPRSPGVSGSGGGDRPVWTDGCVAWPNAGVKATASRTSVRAVRGQRCRSGMNVPVSKLVVVTGESGKRYGESKGLRSQAGRPLAWGRRRLCVRCNEATRNTTHTIGKDRRDSVVSCRSFVAFSGCGPSFVRGSYRSVLRICLSNLNATTER